MEHTLVRNQNNSHVIVQCNWCGKQVKVDKEEESTNAQLVAFKDKHPRKCTNTSGKKHNAE